MTHLPKKHSRWYLLWYPIGAVALIDIIYQALISWSQSDLILKARPELLLLAVLNQIAVYVIIAPAMRRFYAAAHIKVSPGRALGLIGAGMALAKIVPAGDYIVWRLGFRHKRGGVGATTQWQVMYYVWTIGCLAIVFFVFEAITLLLYPHAHAPSLLGNLRFVPVVASIALILALIAAANLPKVRAMLKRFAFEKLGTKVISPLNIIRERKLGRKELVPLTLASFATWLIEGFTMYLCIQALGIDVPLVIAIFGFTFARLFTYLPIVPGGIGEMEAAVSLFFAAYSLPIIPIVTASVIYRMITYWPPLIIGAISYFVLRSRSADGVISLNDPVFASTLHVGRTTHHK